MLSTEPSRYSVNAAGQALASSAFEARKRERSRVKLEAQTQKLAQSLTEAADACLDKFVERVEQILRRDGAEEFLKRIDQVMPEREPVIGEGGDTRARVKTVGNL